MGLESAATNLAPMYGGHLQTDRPEEQLIEAFYKAKEALFSSLPKDSRFDQAEARLAADLVSQQVQAKNSIITSSLESRRDLPADNAITLKSDQSRQYYISKYLVASQGIGGYPAGLARQALDAGALSKQDYLDGIEVRIRGFSEIIHAGNTGQLVDLVNGERRGENIFVTTDKAVTFKEEGVEGLGLAVTTAVLLGVVAAVIVAGIAYTVVQNHKTNLTVAMMSRNCAEAMKQGNDKAIKYCNDFARETASGGAINDIIGTSGKEQLIRYLGYAGAAYLAILILPSLTSSVLSTQEVVREHGRK